MLLVVNREMFVLLVIHQAFYIANVLLFNFLLLLHLHLLLELLVLLFLCVLMKSDLILIRNLNNFVPNLPWSGLCDSFKAVS